MIKDVISHNVPLDWEVKICYIDALINQLIGEG